MDIVGMIFDFLPFGKAVLVVAGMLIGWHVPAPFWAKAFWIAVGELVSRAKEAAMKGFLDAKNFVVGQEKPVEPTAKKKAVKKKK